MSRLTIKVNEEKCIEKGICYLPKDHNSCVFDVLNKLGEWEDLEEQGRLIEQKHGQWDYNKYRQMYCSNCGEYPEIAVEWNYCPNCGAKMDEVE